MSFGDTLWAMLERWRSMAFVAAGGLFALPAVAIGVNAVAGTGIPVSPAAIFLFMLVAFVGLLGLYPRLADRDATVARGGVGLLAVTTAIILATLCMFLLPIGLPGGRATALALVVTVAVGSTLTVTSFGVASLRTGAYSRPVGEFLLTMAGGMAFMIAAMVVHGHSTPAWVGVAVNGLVATSLAAVGLVLRTADIPTDHADGPDDVTAS